MSAPGPRNLITDVTGLKVGQAQDDAARTGVTVILPDAPAVAGVDVRGGGPGTRETDALDPSCMVDAIHAIVLSGGSVYGLEAASSVTAQLGAEGRGFPVPGSPVPAPVVPAAILFDLNNGGDKAWGVTPPYARLGAQALAALDDELVLGNAGAGFGARAGTYKGGTGSASIVTDDGFEIGALVAVNAFGSPVMPGSDRLWAAPFERRHEMGDQSKRSLPDPADHPVTDWPDDTKAALAAPPGANTTIGVVATNATLTPAQATRLAIMAQDGYARALRPIHTPFDGDVVFALATGVKALGDPFMLARLGTLAADCMARAIGRAIHEAQTLGPAKSYRDIFPL